MIDEQKIQNEHQDQPYFTSCDGEKDHAFTMVPNELIRDPEIDPSTKWFISYLLSHVDKWKLYVPYISETQNISIKKVYKMIKTAIAAGYILRESYLVSGRRRFRYQVSRSAKFKKSFLSSQKRHVEKRRVENGHCKEYQSLENTNLKEEEREGAPPPPTPTFSFHKNGRVKIQNDKLDKLYQEFGQQKISDMMDRLDEYADINPKRFKQYQCHATVIRKWIRDDSEKNPHKTPERHLKLIESIKSHPQLGSGKYVKFGVNYVEFVTLPEAKYYFGESAFEEKILNCLRKLGVPIGKP